MPSNTFIIRINFLHQLVYMCTYLCSKSVLFMYYILIILTYVIVVLLNLVGKNTEVEG